MSSLIDVSLNSIRTRLVACIVLKPLDFRMYHGMICYQIDFCSNEHAAITSVVSCWNFSPLSK